MKRLMFCLLLLIGLYTQAQELASTYDYRFGVQIGVDVGGVMPTPLNSIPTVFRAYPQVMPTIGARGEIRLLDELYLGAEFSYKHIAMDIDAVVENMRATLPGQGFGGADMVQYFTGQAEISMSFDLLEVPLYLSYAFPQTRHNRFIFGGYAAWMMRSHFLNNPIQGFVGNAPDVVDLIIEKGVEVPIEQRDFSKYLNHWDWGLVIGYEREIYKRLQLGIHLNWGLYDIFSTSILTYRMSQIRGTVLLSYALWEVSEKN